MPTFGERLTKARKEKKISQINLAEKINKSFTVVGKYERGEIAPPLEIIKLLAQVLEVSVAYLVDENDELSFLSDGKMVKRLKELETVDEESKQYILFTFDSMLRDAKARQTFNINAV